jgi:hypothetical protein
MENTIIGQRIQKFNRIIRWHNSICIVLLLGFGGLHSQYLRNCLLGPVKLDALELSQIMDGEPIDRDFVTVSTPAAHEIDRKVSTNENQVNTTKDKYAIAMVGFGKLMLISTEPDDNLKRHIFTGVLSRIPNDAQSEIIDKIIKKDPELKDKILPLMLEDRDYRVWLYILLPFLISGLGICAWNIYQAKVRTDDPRKHPTYKSLEEYGPGDLLVNSIDSELKAHYDDQALKNSPYYLTPSWLILLQTYNLDFIKLDSLMWAFKQKVQSGFELVIYDKSGFLHQLSLSEQQVDLAIAGINRYAPGAVLGYTSEVQGMWNNQRQEFYALVAKRQDAHHQSQVKND